MRILFVYPNLNTQMGFNQGLAMISAFLKRAGHDTRLINLNENLPPVPSREDIFDEIQAWKPRVIAASTLSQQYAEARDLVTWLRERYAEIGEDAPVFVVGGVHPSMVPEQVMADGVWDHVAVGECEDAMVDLVGRIESGDDEAIASCSNFLSWKGNTRPVQEEARNASAWLRNPVRPFPDITAMPMADYELFDTQRILDSKNGWAGLITSRGCPYRCTYCLNHEVIDTYRADLGAPVRKLNFFRFREPEEVLDEMRFLLSRYERVNTFIMDDDLFTQNVEHAVSFCEAYEKSGIGVPFVVNAHVKQLDERVANALKSAGCTILKMGIESGSPRVRKEVLQRPMSDRDIF
jgi:anaerobic magnesium-protoporphyrin IX monomethyl ester cyclase